MCDRWSLRVCGEERTSLIYSRVHDPGIFMHYIFHILSIALVPAFTRYVGLVTINVFFIHIKKKNMKTNITGIERFYVYSLIKGLHGF